MKQFTTATKRGVAAVNNPVDITFEYEVREGEFVEMTATPPTTGQLALFMSSQGRGVGAQTVAAIFDFLATILDPRDYAIIEDQLRDGLDVAVIVEIVQYLTAEWSGRPTQPPSVSSRSRKSTGRRSTVPAATSTS